MVLQDTSVRPMFSRIPTKLSRLVFEWKLHLKSFNHGHHAFNYNAEQLGGTSWITSKTKERLPVLKHGTLPMEQTSGTTDFSQ